MTFIAAQKFGDRIIFVSDTKLNDPEGITRPGEKRRLNDYIPGILKAVTLSPKVSVAFAGVVARALSAIRDLRSSINEWDFQRCAEYLANASLDGAVDFLIASHIDAPALAKIQDGKVFIGQPFYWIGDPAIGRPFIDAMQERRDQIEIMKQQNRYSYPAGWDENESIFTGAMTMLLLRNPALTDAVGGIPIQLLASPYGHTYGSSAGAINLDTVIRGDGKWFNMDGLEVESGYGQYSYSIVASAYRGAPVVGVWIQETSTGYLYLPLTNEMVFKIDNSTIDQLSALVTASAKDLGGIEVN